MPTDKWRILSDHNIDYKKGFIANKSQHSFLLSVILLSVNVSSFLDPWMLCKDKWHS